MQLTSERKEIALPAATLSKYVGTYEVQPGVDMMIRLDGDHLTTQLTGQPQFPIFAESETKFFLKVVDAQVEFIKDASEAVTHAVMHQNGRDREVKRTSATVAPRPEHKEITLPGSTLARYVGTYARLFGEYNYLWDELAAAAWLDPSLITKKETRFMDVDLSRGANYGNILTWNDKDKPKVALQPVEIQVDLDTERFYRMFVELLKAEAPRGH